MKTNGIHRNQKFKSNRKLKYHRSPKIVVIEINIERSTAAMWVREG